ncbi:DUF7096 domain-containing protein [Natrononativus amylolyticus]|uniref:DUF7096 domain-containing protein n=1 Tax=Natrononativus amylolyticus TaxID=2963434 RepID=UPI0020CC84E0|nr:hypothetical protein [Natrononativus amylolyticus]
MKNAAPVLFALLLCISLPAMTVVASEPAGDVRSQSAPVDAEETPNRLALEGEVRAEYRNTGPDLGATLASTDDALRTDRELYALEAGLEDATADEQRELLETTHDRLAERLEALEQREQAAVEGHAAGNVSDAELMQTLFANYAEAEQLSSAFDDLEAASTTVSGVSISTQGEQAVLDTYRTPVRERLEAAIRGDDRRGSPVIVHRTAETGYSLSMIDGERYTSETTRFDNRNTSATDQFEGSISGAHDRAAEHYPWVFDRPSSTTAGMSAPAQLYHIQVAHTQGDLRLYLDGGTTEVYQERHHLRLAELPSEPVEETWIDDGLELSINETPANGPVEVTVTEDGSGEPVDATVSVDGHEMGETGPGGSLWVIPAAESYEIDVDADGRTVNATVE